MAILKLLKSLPDRLHRDRSEFLTVLKGAARKSGVQLAAPILKAVLSALSERDEKAEICTFDSGTSKGSPEPDSDLRDSESVPLSEDVDVYFAREVEPHVPDAWIDEGKRDPKDGQVGIVGYEINFNRYFYVYEPPRALDAIQADIQAIESDIVRMLAEITGSKP